MKMKHEEKIIGKVEKGFKLTTKAWNLALHLKCDIFRDKPAHVTFRELVREFLCAGKHHEFLTLTKTDLEKDFTFLILATEEAWAPS